ncbi:MAG: Rid family hydrolase [Prolixibacteraceae bacterium]|nr:Rid family hydrolase [Prolixibacteraceae bacterium]
MQKNSDIVFGKVESGEISISFSGFAGEEITEYNLIISPQEVSDFEAQVNTVKDGLRQFMDDRNISADAVFLRRFFISDAANQCPLLEEMTKCDGPVSIVEQPPLNGCKVILWAILLAGKNITKETAGNHGIIRHNGYTHILSTQMHSGEFQNESREQTDDIFCEYIHFLSKNQLTLKDNCLRTWLFVHDIDNNYRGMVNARNRIFSENGLDKNSHFIASTGIEGRHPVAAVKVLMDAYAVDGLRGEQIKFLSAPSHLNPTYEYGVAFERGTAIDYGDRRHIFISGTASIGSRGEILHNGDLTGQTARVFENIRALLKQAGADLNNVTCMIVYLRDIADYQLINKYMQQHYLSIPHAIVLAPVCRPGWLVEVECVAVLRVKNHDFSNF